MLTGCGRAALPESRNLGTMAIQQQRDARTERLQDLQLRLEKVEAVKAIERLQYAYGYYQDRFFYEQIPALFTRNNPSVQWLNGVWEGETGLQRLWLGYFSELFSAGANQPVAGRLFDLPQWQSVVTVAEDGMSAQARFRTLGRQVDYRQAEYWIAGIYENDYVREAGVWKIKNMRFCSPWSASYRDGWQSPLNADEIVQWMPTPLESYQADRQLVGSETCQSTYTQAGMIEFHFSNPVTGARPRSVAFI